MGALNVSIIDTYLFYPIPIVISVYTYIPISAFSLPYTLYSQALAPTED